MKYLVTLLCVLKLGMGILAYSAESLPKDALRNSIIQEGIDYYLVHLNLQDQAKKFNFPDHVYFGIAIHNGADLFVNQSKMIVPHQESELSHDIVDFFYIAPRVHYAGETALQSEERMDANAKWESFGDKLRRTVIANLYTHTTKYLGNQNLLEVSFSERMARHIFGRGMKTIDSPRGMYPIPDTSNHEDPNFHTIPWILLYPIGEGEDPLAHIRKTVQTWVRFS